MAKRRLKKIDVRVSKTVEKAKRAVTQESPENAEKEKLMFMKVGVACVMVIFFVAWIFNLKYQFKINSDNNSQSAFNWQQTKVELDQAMSQVKQGLAQIKQAQNTLPSQPALTVEQIDLLKGKLMGETASSTTATSTIKY